MIYVLVADDDQYIRELVRYHLQVEGYTVLEAADGEEAVRILETQKDTYSRCRCCDAS
ncbi:hypothetical protein GCM10020331_005070 [Ectobacillus funiculus]